MTWKTALFMTWSGLRGRVSGATIEAVCIAAMLLEAMGCNRIRCVRQVGYPTRPGWEGGITRAGMCGVGRCERKLDAATSHEF
jgi:hypothetical protein